MSSRLKHLSERQLVVLVSLFLLIVTATVYWQVEKFDFVNYDDGDYVIDNAQVQEGFTRKTLVWAMTTGDVSSNWHPLTLLSHMLDWQLFGEWAGGHHITSLFFHIVTSLLLFLVFRRMTGDLWKSAFVAAIFAIHPLHVQSVAWISERKDVLSAFFWMLTLWGYAAYVRQQDWLRYAGVMIFFIMGLMSKPMVVTLPFALLLLDFWPLRRLRLEHAKTDFLKLIREKIPLFFLSAVSSVITLHVQQQGGAVKSLDVAPFAYRLPNILTSYINYMLKTIYPVKLSAFYPYPDIFPWWKVSVCGIALVSITWLSIRWMRQRPCLLVGWLWFLGTLVPVIGLVQVGVQSMADRYMYLPMIGLLLMAAWGVSDVIPNSFSNRKHGIVLVRAGAVISILIFSLVTWKQAGYWKNSLTLWRHAIDITKNNYLAHYNLGGALEKTGDIDQAIDRYRESLAMNPLQPDAYLRLGNALITTKKESEALICFQKAVLLSPENDQAQYNMGTFLLKKGEWKAALPYLEKAVLLDPENDQSRFNLANAYFQKKDYGSALPHAKKALDLNPNHEKAHYLAGAILFEHGDYEASRPYFDKVLTLNPANAKAHHYVGAIYLHDKQIDKALASFKNALDHDPDDQETQQLVRQLEIKLAQTEQTILAELKKTPNNAGLRKQLGRLYQSQHLDDKAIEQYGMVLKDHPDSIEAIYLLAAIYADRGETKTAIAYMNQAMSRQPDHPSHAYNMACLYARQGDTINALAWLKKAIDKGYSNWEQIRRDNDLKSIRDTKAFKRIMQKKN